MSHAHASALEEFKAAYPVLLSAIAGTAVGLAGTIVYSMPFFLLPLQQEFGWTRLQLAGAATAHTIGLIIGSPVAGRVADRFGVAKTACVSAILYACMLFFMSRSISSLPSLYAGYLIASFFGAGTLYVCYSRVVSAWFDRGRGLALGLTMSGAGLMAAIIPLALPPLIEQLGWRSGYVALAALTLLAVPINLLVLLKRQKPASAGNRIHAGLTIAAAMRTRQFWTLWIGILILSVTVIGSHLFFVPIITEAGVGRADAPGMVSIYGVGIVVGRILVGFLLDRIHGPYVAAANFLLPAIGMVSLAQFGAPAAVLYLLFLGLAAGAEGDTIGYLASRYFGLKSYSEIFGWLFTALVSGVALGPLFMGGLRDTLGSFTPLLYIGAGNCIFVSLLFLTLGRYRNFEPTHAPSSEPLLDREQDAEFNQQNASARRPA